MPSEGVIAFYEGLNFMNDENQFWLRANLTWSIDRLFFALENGLNVDDKVRVGGRRAGPQLISAQGVIECPSGYCDANDGDFVIIEFSLANSVRSGRLLKVNQIDSAITTQQGGEYKSQKVFSGETARQWAQFLKCVRDYFYSVGLTEVTTPSLVKNPGMEPELEPFATKWRLGSKECKLFLPTSPELHLKQLIVQGHHDIYEIKTVFRNEELTDQHEPEFQMLEWYRAFADLSMIEKDLEGLLQALAQNPSFARAKNLTIKKQTVADLFLNATGFQLKATTTQNELFTLAQELNLKPHSDLSWNDLFHLIWVSQVEEKLSKEPFLLCDYPPQQAALARLNERGWADRFEFYWGGIELANAFYELNDPTEQRRRFERDQSLRIKYGRTPLAIDENFMSALQMGLPPCAGIAMGLDRLFMRLIGKQKLVETRAFSMNHQLR